MSAKKNIFSYFSIKTYVVGTQKNCLNEKIFTTTLKKFVYLNLCLLHMLKSLNTHADVPSGARDVNLGLSINLHHRFR